MEELLKPLVKNVATVVIDFGTVGLSLRGYLNKCGQTYDISGNPAIKFELTDVVSVEIDVIRLRRLTV